MNSGNRTPRALRKTYDKFIRDGNETPDESRARHKYLDDSKHWDTDKIEQLQTMLRAFFKRLTDDQVLDADCRIELNVDQFGAKIFEIYVPPLKQKRRLSKETLEKIDYDLITEIKKFEKLFEADIYLEMGDFSF